jgi:hypothetical protein
MKRLGFALALLLLLACSVASAQTIPFAFWRAVVSTPVISVTPTTLASGTAGTFYSQSLSASGGQPPYSFATSITNGALPTGLSLAANGTISGTSSASGIATFKVSGTDSSTPTHASFTSQSISLTIVPAAPPPGP